MLPETMFNKIAMITANELLIAHDLMDHFHHPFLLTLTNDIAHHRIAGSSKGPGEYSEQPE